MVLENNKQGIGTSQTEEPCLRRAFLFDSMFGGNCK